MLPEKLRQARKKSGLTQVEAARRIGISQSAISQWETDGTEPADADRLAKVAEVYGESLDWLLSTDPKAPPLLTRSADEVDLLSRFRRLSDQARTFILSAIKGLQEK